MFGKPFKSCFDGSFSLSNVETEKHGETCFEWNRITFDVTPVQTLQVYIIFKATIDHSNYWGILFYIEAIHDHVFLTNCGLHCRGYYRCTYRNVQGCLATKQVQKSDEDPMICEITYKGRHTCSQAGHLNKTVAPPSKRKVNFLGANKHQTHQIKNQIQQEKIEQPPETFFTFGSSGLEVKIEDMDHKEDMFPSFCFSSPLKEGSENGDNNSLFSYTMMENNLMENFSPTFISPTSSDIESNIFYHWGSTGIGQSVQSSESDITDIVSAPTSVTNSPIMDLDFFDKIDFDTDFPLIPSELCTW